MVVPYMPSKFVQIHRLFREISRPQVKIRPATLLIIICKLYLIHNYLKDKFTLLSILKCMVMLKTDILTASNYAVILNKLRQVLLPYIL